MRQSANGSGPPPNGLAGRWFAAEPGNCTCRVTVVSPEPAATEAGAKVAIAPRESPVMFRVIAAGRVEPPTGLTTSEKGAIPPAGTFAESPPATANVKSMTFCESTPLTLGP